MARRASKAILYITSKILLSPTEDLLALLAGLFATLTSFHTLFAQFLMKYLNNKFVI